ncbi:hypothetical protein [Bartonella saheliensis]|nr:hypothetical protein [Bartonella saheliensis]
MANRTALSKPIGGTNVHPILQHNFTCVFFSSIGEWLQVLFISGL